MVTFWCNRETIKKLKIWVIGNGQSRENFALNQINGRTIGCNAVHRDHTCDEYVAVDKRMVEEILRNQNNKNSTIHTREDWIDNYAKYKQVIKLPELPFTGLNKCDQPFHWNSGPYAVLVAALYEPTQINLLGFDLWSKTSFVNNIYKGTPNYASAVDRKINPEFWIYQLSKLFKHFKKIEFVQRQPPEWRLPDPWKNIENLTITKL